MKKTILHQLMNPFFAGTLTLLSFCINSFAGTIIPAGDVSGTWTLAGSPYLVAGTIEVPRLQTLSIDPGVLVEVQDMGKLNVHGRLLALGTGTDTIIFTAASSRNSWGGINFYPDMVSDESQMKYCKLQFSREDGIYCGKYTTVSIYNSRITNNFGNGIYCESVSLSIFNNSITNNAKDGINCNDGGATINNNVIAHNSGNGIVSTESGVSMNNNTIIYNSGSGICCINEGSSKITNNIISNNSGNGIICVNFYSPRIDHNIISNNSGSGISCNHWCYPTITNTTIVNNRAVKGGALNCSDFSNPILRNCILGGNTASASGQQVFLIGTPSLHQGASNPDFYYCNVQGGSAAFELNGNSYTGTYQNNMDAEPKFVSPSGGSGAGFNGLTADWSLQSSSPCINSGDPQGMYPATDIAGNPGVSACRIDMGAYEFQSSSLTVNITQVQKVLCFGDTSASLRADPAGGTAPYAYAWNTSPVQTAKTATELSASDYAVIVTDAGGCTNTASVTITQPALLKANAGTNAIVYHGYPLNACAKLNGTAAGGVAPYKYEWSNGIPFATMWVCPSAAKQYTLAVTDANRCKASDAVKVCVVNVEAGPGRVVLCHKKSNGTTVSMIVSLFLVPYHLAHGDVLGACGTNTSCTDAARTIETEADNPIIEDEITLSSSPNPFLQETTIQFTTIEAGQVEVSVYNVMGLKVATLFNGQVRALEIHEEKFNAENLSNGIYFVKLMTEQGDMKVERVILNR